MSESQSPVLAVQDLNVHFAQEHGTLHAVRGLSFELFAGESLAIVGESGSGKSASAMAIMGLQPESARVEGSVVLHGTQLLSSSDQSMSQLRGKSIAMIFQDPLSAMTPVYTIGEQIIEAIQVHDNCSTESAKARAVELLDSVGIAEPHRRVNAYPHEFSGGMRQRALIAMAIANRPDVIIADEPTTALDVTIQAQVLEVLQKACRELNAALIMITHDLGVVARVADKAIVMYAGRAVEQGEVGTLFKRPLMPYTLGLLGSLPSLVGSAKYALNTIDGYPPSALDLPPGCSFAPRCPLVEDACKSSEPILMSTDRPDHLSACIQHELIARESLSHRDLFNAQESTEGSTRFQSVDPKQMVLELKAVKKHYPLYEGAVFRRRVGTVHAVDGIDLHLCQRETLALVGESGCGKSTTALSILDLEEPTEGKIRIFGKDVAELQSRESRLQTRRQLQVVFQDPLSSLDPRMPIFDLIAEPLTVFDYQKNNIQQRVEQLLQLVGLDLSYAERYPQQLSGGQCQRVCIARALALEPQLLILDEPVSALDVSIRAGIINLLDRLKLSHGLAYLFIAHDLALVRHFADRVAIMYLGEIIETGSVDDVYENPSHPYTRCLLSLVPVPDPETERMRNRLVPRGELPSPAKPPSGCRFNTRCLRKPLLGAEQRRHCEENSPELKAVSLSESALDATFRDVHLAACHYPGIKLESS